MTQEVFTPNDTLYRRIVNALKSNYLLWLLVKVLNPGRKVEISNIDRGFTQTDSSKDVVLDVGSGDGYWTKHFSKHVSKIVGIEPYAVDLKKAKRYANIKTEYYEGTAEKLSFEDATFDKIVSVCVFEHLYNDVEAFREFYRVLNNKGTLLATVDSLDSPYVSEHHKKWHMHACYCKQLYSASKISEKLKASGFKRVEAYYIMGSRLSVYWEIMMERIGVFSYIFLPVFYPVIMLSEQTPKGSGYKLFVKATKE